jgi:hypothetical protein
MGGGPLVILMFYGLTLGCARLLRFKRFFALYIVVAVLFTIAGTVFHIKNSPKESGVQGGLVKKTADWSKARTSRSFHQLDVAMHSYVLEFGMTPEPLTPEVLTKVVRHYLRPGPANKFLEKLDNGNLKLRGDLSEYQIGIYVNG